MVRTNKHAGFYTTRSAAAGVLRLIPKRSKPPRLPVTAGNCTEAHLRKSSVHSRESGVRFTEVKEPYSGKLPRLADEKSGAQ